MYIVYSDSKSSTLKKGTVNEYSEKSKRVFRNKQTKKNNNNKNLYSTVLSSDLRDSTGTSFSEVGVFLSFRCTY